MSMGEQLIRAGRELDLDVQIFSHELDRRQPIASIGKVIVGKRYDDEGAIPEVNDLIKSIQADVILPFIDPAIKIAGRCKQKYPHLFAPLSPIDVSEKMFDKVEAAKEFERCGLPIPETYSIENLQYPAIFKPRRGSASKGIKVVENEDELKAAKISNPLMNCTKRFLCLSGEPSPSSDPEASRTVYRPGSHMRLSAHLRFRRRARPQ